MSFNPRYRHRRLHMAAGALLVAVAAATLACRLPMRPPETADIEKEVPPTATTSRADTPTPSPAPATEIRMDTPTPTSTATATITPTATLGPPMFTATTNANCRTGPGVVYDIVRVVMAGVTEPIVGRDAASTWWVVQGGARCWISNITGMASGDLSGVPVIPAPPTPTPSPTATPTVTPTPTLRFIPLPGITIIPLPIAAVSAATVTVDRTSCMPCPCRATWSGTIAATGPLTARYVWETRRDSGPWVETALSGEIVFVAAGVRPAHNFWHQSAGLAGFTLTVRLKVTSPNVVYSNEVPVRYCAP